MSKTTVPDDVRRFILTSIPSVPYLEALLLLRANSARPWDSFNVASRLSISEGQALELLQDMQQARIATRTEQGSFVYLPAIPELNNVIDRGGRFFDVAAQRGIPRSVAPAVRADLGRGLDNGADADGCDRGRIAGRRAVLLPFLAADPGQLLPLPGSRLLAGGGNRIALAVVAHASEREPLFYLVRLLGYGLILVAIWQKNRRAR